VPHISSYALTLEPKTALEHFVAKGVVSLLDDAEVEAQFLYLVDCLTKRAMNIMSCQVLESQAIALKNNTAYWQGKPYLGIGPSAHGFDGENRYWNVSNNAAYMKLLSQQMSYHKLLKNCTVIDKFNEAIMIGLRASWGVSLTRFRSTIRQTLP
jgi:oxygen-independent coproporphyrinogen-3 oxidase